MVSAWLLTIIIFLFIFLFFTIHCIVFPYLLYCFSFISICHDLDCLLCSIRDRYRLLLYSYAFFFFFFPTCSSYPSFIFTFLHWLTCLILLTCLLVTFYLLFSLLFSLILSPLPLIVSFPCLHFFLTFP